ncbi:metallophosphoesterase, MG_246/BB_0505 family [Sphaerochaeta pleomorpha str. Grapes]|uniref:Metallophosphoesterase, MG_246/BB_0505 family n=1 Tax=Sphaerochaeta pleomorpha (strain ATCC BAA-1885 / DSM 22778 / Grapes) TaxID=158190 RepID=G8QRL6_SPHPG|nr:TIGR00282 family metallophosphoesterase [Sphaerochaeta pleomorpha]AEV29938.1 metallophosphoesterase, MG_246/BB_0505 family [Sphaerochaeta pleomorpha str. Grapes]
MSDSKTLAVLLLGDVCGQPGCRALFMGLGSLVKDFRADLVVVNGENAANGFGLSSRLMDQFFALGVHVITSGNHIWQQDDLLPYLDSEQRLLRPANYPPQAPGHGSTIVDCKGYKVGVLNLQGRQQLVSIDCPFRVGLDQVQKLRKQTPMILVDFHAENTEEKEALGLYLDGKVSAFVGTHTHVQTADEKILPLKTAYITDLGLCGPSESVIGSDPVGSIAKQISQMPLRSEIADHPPVLQGVFVTIEVDTGNAVSVERFTRTFAL